MLESEGLLSLIEHRLSVSLGFIFCSKSFLWGKRLELLTLQGSHMMKSKNKIQWVSYENDPKARFTYTVEELLALLNY